MRSWTDVESDIFGTGDEAEVRTVEQQLRNEVRAYQLAEIRKARHITQREVAKTIGVSAARSSMAKSIG